MILNHASNILYVTFYVFLDMQLQASSIVCHRRAYSCNPFFAVFLVPEQWVFWERVNTFETS